MRIQLNLSGLTQKLKFIFLLPFLALGAQALEPKIVIQPEPILKNGLYFVADKPYSGTLKVLHYSAEDLYDVNFMGVVYPRAKPLPPTLIREIDVKNGTAVRERNYFGTMLVETGQADAMITGYSHAYPNAIRPALEIIKKDEGVERIAATSIMLTKQGPLFLSDATINIDPTAEELANIALLTARAVKFFGLKPSVAMLSYSNFGSAVSESSLKVREAVAYLHKNHPDLVVDGEIQADFALNPDKIAKNYPFSKLNKGKGANVLIFPNLEAANISYKLLKETQHLDTIGPVILGLSKPIHITTIGSTVDEMVNLATLAVIDAQQK